MFALSLGPLAPRPSVQATRQPMLTMPRALPCMDQNGLGQHLCTAAHESGTTALWREHLILTARAYGIAYPSQDCTFITVS